MIYFGFTIGPIYEVISNGKKTREIWAGSYLFSEYVKKFCEIIIKKGYKLISPYYNSKSKEINRVGLFPDHIIGYSNKNYYRTKCDLIKINKSIKNELIESIIKAGKNNFINGKSGKYVAEIINFYLKTDIVFQRAKESKNFFKKIEKKLKEKELSRYFNLGENNPSCYRCKILPAVFRISDRFDEPKVQLLCPICFLKFKSFDIRFFTAKMGRFLSTGEISALDLISQVNESALQKYLENFDEISLDDRSDAGKSFKTLINNKIIKNYHKYFAVVIADGDNFGKFIENMEVEKIQVLSCKLYNFSLNIARITKEFGGSPVYIGGEDMMIFMPLCISKGNDNFKTLFNYIESCKNEFQKEFQKPLSISFGIFICYYKFPLSIAIEKARELLSEAKSIPGKNSVNIVLTQHSGHETKLLFSFNKNIFDKLNDLMIQKIKS